MSSCKPKGSTVPVITVRVLVIAHIFLAVFILGMAWLDWTLPT
jgi:hypothetical protein